MYRFKQPLSFEVEWTIDDLRQIRLSLADSDTELIGPWTQLERFQEASDLVDEVMRLWRHYRRDVEFARRWAHAVIMHSDARASQGAAVQVTEAVEALQDLAAEFDGNPEFLLKASMLAHAAAGRAARNKDMATASEMLGLLEQVARRDSAPPGTIAVYAQAACAICMAYEEEQRWKESMSTARQATWAIRSEAFQERMRERGMGEADMEYLMRWVQQAESAGA